MATLQRNRLTQKQERFCLEYFATGHARNSAITAGYPSKSADVVAAENLTKPSILSRMAELNAPIVERAVSTKEAKLVKLEEIYNKPLPSKVTVREIIGSIAEHNKMENIYETRDVNIDNRQVNIYVIDSEAKELLERIGERLNE